jgi:hypothetical protein
MLNFFPQFFMAVSNKTSDLLLSFFTLKPQQQWWRHFKISFHNLIFPNILFPLYPRILLLEVKTVSLGPSSTVHVMKSLLSGIVSPTIHLQSTLQNLA